MADAQDGDAGRHARIEQLFHAAAELPPDTRTEWLQAQCGGDEALRSRVEAMLVADAEGHQLLDRGLALAAGQLMTEADPALPSHTFGPYRVTGMLGEGGMGVVYRAFRDDLKSEAAIKILRDATLSPARRERFAFEQRALAQLNHPAIARLYDAGALPDGTPWFAMELVEGESITSFARSRSLSVEARVRLFREACEAVQHAHEHAILHRDLKPSNILVRPDGRVKLLDFGIAKPFESLQDTAGMTRTGLRLMTPAYAAPEQMRGEALGVRTDVYSLGVVLYELLARRLPFDLDGRTPSDAATVLATQAPKKPSAFVVGEDRTHTTRGPGRSAWSDLDVLVLTAMHSDPARRYATVDALVRDLDRYLEGRPLEARGDSVRYRTGKFVRRHAPAVTATALAFVAIVSLVGFYTLRLRAARNEAQAQAARTQRIQRFMSGLFTGGEQEAGPSDTLRVVTLLERGAEQARTLSSEPAVQAELERTLGGIFLSMGRMPQADTLLAHALAHTLSVRPPDDLDVAHSLIGLARLRAQQEHFDEAERLARQGLERVRRPGPGRQDAVAEATAVLGGVLVARGRNDDAVSVLVEAVRLYSRAGEVTAGRAQALTDLGNAHFDLGHYPQADSIFKLVIGISRQLYGPRHPNVADDLFNLGAVQFAVGHYPEAERDYREALDITRGWYGPEHPKTASAMTVYARGLLQEEPTEERQGMADSLLRQALAVREHAYGPESHEVASTLNEVGNLALDRLRYDDAAAAFRRTVEIYRHAYGDHHSNVAIALGNLGSVYMSSGDNVRAEGYFRQALAAYEGAEPATSINVGIARIKLGRVLMRQKRYAEAERQTRMGYDSLVSQADSGISFLKAARKDLVADYEALGRTAEAARFRAELTDSAGSR
jgi:serine/threonine protein kinase/tetratricopeptide (TPR) repeat protein